MIRHLTLCSLCVVGIACSPDTVTVGDGTDSKATGVDPRSEVVSSGRVHVLPKRLPGAGALQTTLSKNMLVYYGGKVIPNAKVYNVNWGGAVNAQLRQAMPQFYGSVMNSPYIDWLNEYDTAGKTGLDGQAGSNQRIGRGSLGGDFTITPSLTSLSISDTQIQQELARQISSGALPAPDDNAFYAINFPKGAVISQGGSTSCQVFCAYHGTFQRSGQNVYYSVIPSMEAGTGCETGCGSGTLVNMTTGVASHELIEAITDAEVGLGGSSVGRPLAWYNTSQGEIGDICNATDGTVTGADGLSWNVQTEYDNASGTCIVQKTVSVNDFTVSLSPSSATVAAGGTSTFSITTTAVGTAQTVALTLSGLSAGLTGSISPASVTAGQAATLTVTAAPTAAAGTTSFTVTGVATSGNHSTSGSIAVTTASGGETVLANGVAATGLSGATGAQAFFRIDVPAGASTLTITTAGGTGDVDLYVRASARPSLQTYDCRPYLNGNAESCNVPAPTAGTYYVLLNAYAAYSGVSLTASYGTGGGGGDPSLTNNVPVAGLSGAKGSAKYFQLVVPPTAASVTFTLSGSTSSRSDADLYVQFGAHPTTTTFACRSWATGSNETCTLTAPRAGTYYVLIQGYTAYSGVTLTGKY